MTIYIQNFKSDAYGKAAALRYNIFESRPEGFALKIAPKIVQFFRQNSKDIESKRVLDLACGTGQLAHYLLSQGYEVTGIDLSEEMLKYANANNKSSIGEGKCEFIIGDSSNFKLDSKFGLAVSTFNGMNHLSSFEQVELCLNNVYEALVPGGYFLFDINTQLGLTNVVAKMEVHDSDEEIIVRKRIFDGTHIILNASGCFLHEGDWIRYQETILKIVIETIKLKDYILKSGWSSVSFMKSDFLTPVENPELDEVCYVVARK
jgi:SAM-dependent methyltransferase